MGKSISSLLPSGVPLSLTTNSQKTISHLPRRVVAGFCPHCHRWLGKASTDLVSKDTTLASDLWTSEKKTNEAIFDLLRTTSDNPLIFGDQGLFRSFRRLLAEVFDANLAAFSRVLGVSARSTGNYCNGLRPPSIQVVLTLSKALNLSLVQIYSGNFNSSHIAFQPTKKIKQEDLTRVRIPKDELARELETELMCSSENPQPIGKIAERLGWPIVYLFSNHRSAYDQIQDRWKSYALRQLQAALLLEPPVTLQFVAESLDCRRSELRKISEEACNALKLRYQQGMRLKWERQLQELETALDAVIPKSVEAIALTLDVGGSDLWRRHPELCQKLSARFAQYRKDQHVATMAKNRQQIRQAVLALHVNGSPFPGRNQVFRTLPSNISIRAPADRQAYKDAIQELRQSAGTRDEV